MNSKVIFKFDIEKDAKNYWECANSDSHWGNDFTKSLRPEVFKKLKEKKWSEIKNYILDLLKKGYAQDNEKDEKKLKLIQKSWGKIERKFFRKLAKITKHKIYTNRFDCYITTIGRCPYHTEKNWFMTNIFWDIDNVLMSTAHELMHLQFHYYFEKKLRRKISRAKFHDIKESLTVLLNLEFEDILKKKDKGYPSHKGLRKFIEQEWKKNSDFDILLNKCINYLK